MGFHYLIGWHSNLPYNHSYMELMILLESQNEVFVDDLYS